MNLMWPTTRRLANSIAIQEYMKSLRTLSRQNNALPLHHRWLLTWRIYSMRGSSNTSNHSKEWRLWGRRRSLLTLNKQWTPSLSMSSNKSIKCNLQSWPNSMRARTLRSLNMSLTNSAQVSASIKKSALKLANKTLSPLFRKASIQLWFKVKINMRIWSRRWNQPQPICILLWIRARNSLTRYAWSNQMECRAWARESMI